MTAFRCRRRHPLRPGFTLVELMVAIVIMTVGVLGLASTAAVVMRLMGGGAQQTLAAHVAQSRFEWLRSRQCALITNGYATVRGVQEKWTVATIDATTFDVVDTVRYTTRAGLTAQAYRSAVRCQP